MVIMGAMEASDYKHRQQVCWMLVGHCLPHTHFIASHRLLLSLFMCDRIILLLHTSNGHVASHSYCLLHSAQALHMQRTLQFIRDKFHAHFIYCWKFNFSFPLAEWIFFLSASVSSSLRSLRGQNSVEHMFGCYCETRAVTSLLTLVYLCSLMSSEDWCPQWKLANSERCVCFL